MAAFGNANTKRYSWWWGSHISPKNSKWLQENLTDMDSKVKQMIKVIEEDADSFARRAEMYYKKRPELMKLVEEFYRAYRALAERCDHATGVIRHAQQTMAEAFPNQDPMMFGEESLLGPSTPDEFDPQTPESYPPIRAPVYPSDLQKGALGISSSHMSTVKRNIAFMEDPQSNGKGLKIGKARRGLNFNDADEINGRNAKVLSESERASKAEAEILALKDALTKVQAEKEASLAQFDQHLERLSNMESEVSRAQEDSRCFNERATRAEAEVQTLRETLSKQEVEKESSLLQYQQCIENIAGLEERISLAQKEAGEVNERASRAEAEIITLKQSLVGSETDKEAALVRYQQCLETISNLEERLRKAEEDARLMNQRAENADGEVESLKAKVSRLTQENEAYELQYQQCLETIADLKLKLFHAQEETQRLSREIEDGVAKLKFAEEKCVVLERSNQNLHSELDGLLEKLGNQSHELTEKQKEMGKLWTTIQEEHLRFVDAETAFQTLQQLHSQSQEELNTSALELQNRSQILKDMEARNSDLLEEVQEAKNENNILNELNLTSAASVKSLHEEVSRLQETIQKLEAEVELRVDQRNALQQEIYCLKEELSQMGKKHQSILEQVELVGLHPEGFGSSIKELQEEHSKLKEIKERKSIEKTALLEKLELMEKLVQKNLLLENSISDLNSELKTIRGELKTLEEACVSLAEEKSGLHFEKNMLVSRLQNATEDSKKLSEENSLLENSLSDANAELEALKSKLKSLEDSCHLLNDDKSSLVNEREILLSYMDVMRKNIEDLEKEQAELNVKVLELATERESCLHKIKELGVSLDSKDRDHASFMQLSESQMNGMKSKIYHLQDENQRKEREYQDRAHDAHVEIIVLQKCLQEWLKKSSSLVAENQNLKQAGHLLEKLVSELEHENIGKQVQIDSSVNCIKVLRTGIYQVLMKLEVIPGIDSGDENSQDQKNIHEVLSRLDEMQTMLLKIQRENHQGTIENLVLVEFLRQLKSEAVGIATGKKVLEKELESERSQLLLLRDEIQKLINMNGELTTEVNQGVDREEVLTVKIEDVRRQSAIENLVLVELIKQLKSEALGITTEKSALEEELESHRDQLSFSRNESKNLSYLIGELTTKVDQGIIREEVLKVEVDDLYKQSAIENLVLVEFLKQLKSIAAGIATEKSALEEELESHGDQLSFSQNEAKNLNHMIGELTTKINQGVNREKVLKVEVDQGVDREKVLKVEIEDLHRQSAIENFVLVEFLHQLKSEAVDIATEKETLEEELESKCCQLSFSRDEAKNLSHMIEELTTKVNQRVNREEVLKVEVDDLHMQSAIKNLVLVEFLTKFKSEAVCIATEKESLEEELESQHSKLLLSLDETQKLINMIGELTTKINQGVNREEALKVENEDLHMQSAIENLVLVEFLQELKSEAVGVASEKKNLEEELESKRYQLLILRDEAKNHIYLIGDLTTKVNEGVNREEVLKVEADDLHMQSAIENFVLVEFFRSQAVGIATEKRTLEEELQSQLCLLSFSQDETKKLSHMIEELTTKVNQGVNREEVLNVAIENLQMLSALKNLVLVEFLQQLKSEAIGIATEKQALEEELVSQHSKLSFSRDEAQKLIYMNGELTKKVNQGVDREEVLKGKNEDLQMLSAIKNLVFVEFLQQLKSEAVGIATEKENLEEELESKSYQLWISQDETKNLNYMIGELTTKVNQGVNREEVLKVEFEDLQMQSATENLVLAEFFKQFKSEAAGIAKTLEDELESLHSKLSFSRDETKKLIYLNGELTTKMNQGVSREEVLKVENEDFQILSAIKNLVLVESLCQLKSEAVCIATEKKFLEEELESQRSKFSLSRDETQELIYMNGELTTKIKQGVSREEVLNVEIEDLHMQVLQLRNEFTILQRDNYKNLDKNSYLTNSTLRLEEEKRKLEEDISLLLSETVYQSSLFILLEDLVLEKLSEAVKLKEDLERLSFVKCKLEEEVREVGDKLRSTETENLQLEGLLEKTDAELLSARSDNDQLEHEIANVKDELVQKEKELLEAMLMISVMQSENSELSKALEDLECRYKETKAVEEDKDKQVLKLQEDYSEQIKKTAHANEANMKLEADLLNLLMELEGIKAEKENLNQELSKEKNKVELWESQASTLFGDLQVSVVHETFLKGLTHELAESYSNFEHKSTLKDVEIDQLNMELSKEKKEVELWETQASTLFGDLHILVVHKILFEGLVHELAEACNNLENRCTSKDVEIDQLRGRVNNLEDVNKGQEDLMSKFDQAFILLRESIESLEKHIEDEPTKDIASMVDNKDGFLELEEMCLKIKAIEEALTKKLAMEELKTSARRSRRRSGSLRKQNHEIYPQESEMITKDIVLDQVSDCSSYGISKRDILKIEEDNHVFEVQTGRTLSEESLVVDKLEISDRFTDPNKEVNKRKVLERLHSDLQKLSNLHIAVEDLKTKVERDERSEKGKENEYETVKGQIYEAEEALEKLLSVNRKLVTKVVSGFEISDGSKSSVDLDEDERSRRRRISEQARRGSEKIGRLQFEIQRLQHLLLKLEGEREDRAKAKTSADSKTRTLLKDYIYGGVRGERRKRLKKRFAFCGCVQQPPPSP